MSETKYSTTASAYRTGNTLLDMRLACYSPSSVWFHLCKTGWYIYINPTVTLFLNPFKKSRIGIFGTASRNFAFKSKWQKYLLNSFWRNIEHLFDYYILIYRVCYLLLIQWSFIQTISNGLPFLFKSTAVIGLIFFKSWYCYLFIKSGGSDTSVMLSTYLVWHTY